MNLPHIEQWVMLVHRCLSLQKLHHLCGWRRERPMRPIIGVWRYWSMQSRKMWRGVRQLGILSWRRLAMLQRWDGLVCSPTVVLAIPISRRTRGQRNPRRRLRLRFYRVLVFCLVHIIGLAVGWFWRILWMLGWPLPVTVRNSNLKQRRLSRLATRRWRGSPLVNFMVRLFEFDPECSKVVSFTVFFLFFFFIYKRVRWFDGLGGEEYGVECTVCYQVRNRFLVIYPVKLNVGMLCLDMFLMEL